MADKVTFVNSEGKKVTLSNTVPDCKVDSIEPTTADKRAAACAEAFNIIRTLFSNGVLFRVQFYSNFIVFTFRGAVHITTAKRILPNQEWYSDSYNDEYFSLKWA